LDSATARGVATAGIPPPTPSWPSWLSPQQYGTPPTSAQAWPPPTSIALACPGPQASAGMQRRRDEALRTFDGATGDLAVRQLRTSRSVTRVTAQRLPSLR